MALLIGAGYRGAEIELGHADAWLPNSADGEIAHVTGPSGEVDLRVLIEGAEGDDLQVVEGDEGVYVHNVDSGVVLRVDPSTFTQDASWGAAPGSPLSLLPADDVLYIVDGQGGRVRAVDPVTFEQFPGSPFHIEPGNVSGAVDPDGLLWVAQPRVGRLVSIDADPEAGEDRRSEPFEVGDPGDQLAVMMHEGEPAVFNLTDGTYLAPTRGIGPVELDLSGDAEPLPPAAGDWPGPAFTTDRSFVTLDEGGGEAGSAELGEQGALGRPIIDGDRVYVGEPATGNLYVLQPDGDVIHSPPVVEGGGGMRLAARDDYAFVVSGQQRDGWVVDPDGGVDAFVLNDPEATTVDEEGEVTKPSDEGEGDDDDTSDDPLATGGGTVTQTDLCQGPNPPEQCDPGGGDGGDRCEGSDPPPSCGGGDGVECGALVEVGGVCKTPCVGTGVTGFTEDGCTCVSQGMVQFSQSECYTPCPDGQTGFVENSCTCANGGSTSNGCVLTPCPPGQTGSVETGCSCDNGGSTSNGCVLTPCPPGQTGYVETGCTPDCSADPYQVGCTPPSSGSGVPSRSFASAGSPPVSTDPSSTPPSIFGGEPRG